MTELIRLSRSAMTPTSPATGLSFLIVVVLCIVTTPLLAEPPQLPKGEAVMDNFAKAVGGRAPIKKVRNRVTKMTLNPSGPGLEAHITVHAQRPDKMQTVVDLGALGKIMKGSDGKVVWETSPFSGPAIKKGDERLIALRDADLDSVVRWRKHYWKAECVGIEEIKGKPCYKVVLAPREGSNETRYFDTKTHLMTKTELTMKVPKGDVKVDLYPADYKVIDGIMFPHTTRRVSSGQEVLIRTDSIEHNVMMPKELFKMPDEVKSLIDDEAKEERKDGAAEGNRTT